MTVFAQLTEWLHSPANIPWEGIVAAGIAAFIGVTWRVWAAKLLPSPVDPLTAECEKLRFQIRVRDWELALTRRFLGARDLPGRLQLLLDSLLPNPQNGFAAVFRIMDQHAEIEQSVGLHPEVIRKLTLSHSLIENIVARGSLGITSTEIAKHRLITGFSTYERARLSTLYCLRLGSGSHPWGLLISTELPTIQSGELASLSGWEHLTSILGEELAAQESIDRQGNELAFTREMLELRSLADQQYRSPSHLLQEFLKRLTEMSDFDRATLILSEEEQQLCNVPLLRGGGPLSREVLAGWEHSENLLLTDAASGSNSVILTETDLHRLGVHGPFSMAVILPLRHHDWIMGQLCLTRRNSSPMSDSHRRLLIWSSQFLVELIARTVDRAAIELLAKRDALTQLANRHAFDSELDRSVDRALRLGDHLSLVLLDLDHFKAVNDTYGHLGGDCALKTVAHVVERSVQAIRDGDQPLVARYGGEEIVVLLPGVSIAGAKRIAESIREAVTRTPILFDEKEFRISLSAGVASVCDSISTSRALVSAADAALYRAKANGRNRVEITATEVSLTFTSTT